MPSKSRNQGRDIFDDRLEEILASLFHSTGGSGDEEKRPKETKDPGTKGGGKKPQKTQGKKPPKTGIQGADPA